MTPEIDIPDSFVLCECSIEGKKAANGIKPATDCRCALLNELAQRRGGFSHDAAKRLFSEVLRATWDDYVSKPPKPPKKHTAAAFAKHAFEVKAWRTRQADADLLLHAQTGPWRRCREVLCALSGVDADAVRSRAVNHRETGNDPKRIYRHHSRRACG